MAMAYYLRPLHSSYTLRLIHLETVMLTTILILSCLMTLGALTLVFVILLCFHIGLEIL